MRKLISLLIKNKRFKYEYVETMVMEEQIKELQSTFLEEIGGALDQFSKNNYKNSIILLSKALFALCDIVVFLKLDKLPKNHSERFRILEEHFNNIYLIVDEVWSSYADSYSKPALKETCEELKNAIKKINNLAELPREIKEAIGKI